jgi:aminoglycoside phosphotransferase family enzyme/predicted kinase
MDLPRLIEALSDPAAYAFPVGSVDVRQTHISAVFLVGPYAYKVKKPVSLGFLDFSTLEKRRDFCEEEVRLNRRLAPHAYLGVVPVVRVGKGLQFEGAGDAVEWAVKMQRLPDEATLQKRLGRGEVGTELVESLANRIASFHREAETNERIAAFGRIEAVTRTIMDIFAQAESQVGATVSRAVFARVKALAEEALGRLGPLIEARSARGMPRDCHGDLHLDHVYYFPDQGPPADLVIIDCIEFNERFRFIDPIADMAFPAMDLAFHGRRDLAQAFADAYFQATRDEEGRALLPLYAAHRAMVRGMVEGLELAEKEVPEAERAAALGRARAHWLLALTELEKPGRRPCLLLVMGLPGTGKSRLALELAESAGFSVVRSDVVRKELAGFPGQGQAPLGLRESLYTPACNERTYAECLYRAERLLFEGRKVLVDATFHEEQKRRTFLKAAVRWGVPAGILLCRADPETARRRLENRQGDASDADWSVYLQLAASWEEMSPLAGQVFHPISTEGSPEQALGRALEALRQSGLNGRLCILPERTSAVVCNQTESQERNDYP